MSLLGRLVGSVARGAQYCASDTYDLSVDWFSPHIPSWTELLARHVPAPERILEIGCFEGNSTIWLIENAFKSRTEGHITCIDTWMGGEENDAAAMAKVEERFDHNVALARRNSIVKVRVDKTKGPSHAMLLKLLAAGKAASYDLVYVDGSHQAPDVMADLVMGFMLCKTGGVIACDDYLWTLHPDPLHRPRIAIDNFAAVYAQKLRLLEGLSEYQRYFIKTRD